jgi:hypothetical protein
LTELPSFAVPRFGYADPDKRSLWKWLLGGGIVFAIFLMWQCGSLLNQGRSLSNSAVDEFHARLNQGDYDAIYSIADDDFRRATNHVDFVKLMETVHTKLGEAVSANLQNISFNSTASRTFFTAHYNSSFLQGSALETFIWSKTRNGVRLYRYHIQSDVFTAK